MSQANNEYNSIKTNQNIKKQPDSGRKIGHPPSPMAMAMGRTSHLLLAMGPHSPMTMGHPRFRPSSSSLNRRRRRSGLEVSSASREGEDTAKAKVLSLSERKWDDLDRPVSGDPDSPDSTPWEAEADRVAPAGGAEEFGSENDLLLGTEPDASTRLTVSRYPGSEAFWREASSSLSLANMFFFCCRLISLSMLETLSESTGR